jgi:hypothetical protein
MLVKGRRHEVEADHLVRGIAEGAKQALPQVPAATGHQNPHRKPSVRGRLMRLLRLVR